MKKCLLVSLIALGSLFSTCALAAHKTFVFYLPKDNPLQLSVSDIEFHEGARDAGRDAASFSIKRWMPLRDHVGRSASVTISDPTREKYCKLSIWLGEGSIPDGPIAWVLKQGCKGLSFNSNDYTVHPGCNFDNSTRSACYDLNIKPESK